MILGALSVSIAAAVGVVSCTTSQSSLRASLSAVKTPTAVADSVMFAFDLPAAPLSTDTSNKRSLWATYYHVWYAEVTTGTGHVLLDMNGQPLTGALTPRDWCMAGVEGTVLVKESNGSLVTYNYAGRGQDVQVDCAPYFNKGTLINPVAIGKTRWTLARGPFGDGVKGLILVPYRTIAVDTLTYPIGSVIYVPIARGQKITLPNGKSVEHDGYFFAGDIGGAIKELHIDVFAGTSTKNPFPAMIGNKSSVRFDAYLIHDESIRERMRAIHQLQEAQPTKK
jgi:3D (Asp-Asp-Asp) domain-containing protein